MITDDEQGKKRLKELESFQIINSDIEKELEGLVELASNICDVPISLVNLLEENHWVTKSGKGINNIERITSDLSFCTHTLEKQDLMIIEDTHKDEQFKDNYYVKNEPNIRFYAGMPLRTSDGNNLGTICVIDHKPRQLTQHQQESLKILGKEVVARFNLIKQTKKLKQRNDQFKKVNIFLDNLSDIRVIIDPDTHKILEINEEAINLFECNRSDIIGKKFGSRVKSRKTRKNLFDFLERQRESTTPFTAPLQTDTGKTIFLEHTFTTRDGLWYLTARNVTQKEKKLTKYSQAIMASNDGIAILDGNYNFNYINDAFADIFDYEHHDLMDAGWEILYNTKQQKRFNDILDRKLQENYHWRGEIRAQKKDGTDIPLEISLDKLNSGDLVCIIRDISDRKKAENELQREKELSDKIINSLPIPFFMFDKKGNFVRWNNEFRKTTGFSEQKIAYSQPLDFFPQSDHKIIRNIFQKIYDEGGTSVQTKFRNREETFIPSLCTFSHFEDEKKNYIIGTILDISELKKYQNQLQQSLEEKEVLLAEVHHRVKNNLAIITGLLQMENFNVKEESVRKILQNTRMRIMSIAKVHELLYKAESFNNLKFDSFVTDIINSIKNTKYSNRDISFRTSIDEVELNVNQAIPFGLIINELLTNACEHAFNSDKKAIINVRMSQNGKKISLIIGDNGEGLPENFSLSDNKSLGFTIINTLTKQLNANFSYESKNGTKFKLLFEKKAKKGSASSLRLQ